MHIRGEAGESLALSVVIVTTVVGTMLYMRRSGGRFRLPKATLAVAAVTLVVSVLGNLNSEALHLLDRDRSMLLAGEWWRLVTPLFVQDGGWSGTIFNISALIVIGLCTETLHRRSTFLVVYFLAGLISEVVAYTLIPDQGYAGNSVATMGAAGLCLVTLCVASVVPSRIFGIIGVLCRGPMRTSSPTDQYPTTWKTTATTNAAANVAEATATPSETNVQLRKRASTPRRDPPCVFIRPVGAPGSC